MIVNIAIIISGIVCITHASEQDQELKSISEYVTSINVSDSAQPEECYEELLDAELEDTVSTIDLVRTRYNIVQELSKSREEHRAAYKELCKEILQKYIKAYPKSDIPQKLLFLNPADEIESYSLALYDYGESLHYGLVRTNIRIQTDNPDNPYQLSIPIPDINRRHDLRICASYTLTELCGTISHEVADITEFTSLKRGTFKKRLGRTCTWATSACFLGTSAYLLYNDTERAASIHTTMYHLLLNATLHSAGFLGLTYASACSISSRERNDQRHIDNRVTEHSPVMFNIEPVVICLTREYVHYRLKESITHINRRRPSGWLCCRPVFGRLLDCFKRRLDNKQLLPQRIYSLLASYHGKLSKQIMEDEREKTYATCTQEAADLICTEYDSILINMHELREINLPNIIAQSHLGNFTTKQMTFLASNINGARETLQACMPRMIHTLAQEHRNHS